MKVSAIMPTWNQFEFIHEALGSVRPQVDELVIVDDGSTDNTMTMAVDVRHTNNLGTAEAINSGFELTTGELVTWVSSDNVHTPDWRAVLEARFDDKVGVVYSGFRYGYKGRDLFRGHQRDLLINDQNCYYGPSFMIRREVWEKAGPHRGKISHDYDHWLRIEEACWEMGLEIRGVPKALCVYRVHPKRQTITRKDQYDAHIWQEEARRRRSR
ncbi:MAG: glycosyltransferase [Sulfitobacter sp.]|nr:glycosyltransferase [Sulfitobacter sp.]